MEESVVPSRIGRADHIVLALALLASVAYFYPAGGWNQNSRFDLVRAIVERRSLSIDAFHGNTADKARAGEHYYSDKAPGASLTAVPLVALARPIVEHATPDTATRVAALSWLSAIAASGLPAVAAALVLHAVALRLGASRAASRCAAIVFLLGTPMWAYATLFWGHALTAAGLVVAYAAAVALREPGAGRRDAALGGVVGLAAGWATVTEFPAAVPAVAIGVLAVIHARRAGGWPRVARVGATLVAGAAAAMVVLLVYNHAAFGSALHLSYSSVLPEWTHMHKGFHGLTYPRPQRLWNVLAGEYRGLLPLAPILALAPIGLVMLGRARATRPAAIVAAGIIAYYWLLNGSYDYWSGGWSYGPRHMAAALPFACLGLAPVWDLARRWLAARVALVLLAAWGVALACIAVSTTPQPPEIYKRPMRELLLPAFVAGDLSLNHMSFLEAAAEARKLRDRPADHDAWNLGELMGLRGKVSLVPLVAVWMLAAVVLARRRLRS